MRTDEVAPGIHRIESVLGPRPFAQYLLWGGAGGRSLLVDTGVLATPEEVILPALGEIGLDPANLDYVLISHADVDHFGGNDRIRAAAPRAIFCAHGADAPWIGDRERILRERYGWYARHGAAADYDSETKAWLRGAMAQDVPVDLELAGGERFRLGSELTVEVLSLPGHSRGHIGLWEPAWRTAIVIDAVLGGGLLDNHGTVIHPPPYFDAAAYEATVRRLQALRPRRLLTAHYAVLEGAEVDEFLAESAAFVGRAREAVGAALVAEGELTLGGLLERLSPTLGPFSSMANELCGPLLAHLDELVASGRAEEVAGQESPVWRVVRR
jgi:glyoxylase-like metal-dependent hydrolase (beta-lactamase superfamily II)